MKEYLDFIRDKISARALLEQVAEEASSLACASINAIKVSGLSENNVTLYDCDGIEMFHKQEQRLMLLFAVMSGEYPDIDESSEMGMYLKYWCESLGFVKAE